jgi:hypothetical protein
VEGEAGKKASWVGLQGGKKIGEENEGGPGPKRYRGRKRIALKCI